MSGCNNILVATREALHYCRIRHDHLTSSMSQPLFGVVVPGRPVMTNFM